MLYLMWIDPLMLYGDSKSAKILLDDAISELRMLAKKESEYRSLANLLNTRGELLCQKNNILGAEDLQDAEQILQPLSVDSYDYNVLVPWIKSRAYQNKSFQAAMERLIATGYYVNQLQEQLTREYPICHYQT